MKRRNEEEKATEEGDAYRRNAGLDSRNGKRWNGCGKMSYKVEVKGCVGKRFESDQRNRHSHTHIGLHTRLSTNTCTRTYTHTLIYT